MRVMFTVELSDHGDDNSIYLQVWLGDAASGIAGAMLAVSTSEDSPSLQT